MQITSCEMPGWMKHKFESRFLGEISITLVRRWHHPYGRKWRTKEFLFPVERGGWKSWLKTQHSENEDHGIWSYHLMANRWGNKGNSERFSFLAPKSLQMVIAAMKLKDTYSLEGKLWPTQTAIQNQRHYFVNKVPSSQGYGFSSGHVWMWELDYKES